MSNDVVASAMMKELEIVLKFKKTGGGKGCPFF
jgi:hypothetical protein